MVRDRLRDGRRIAQLLASEIEGDGGTLAELSVIDADRDVDPTIDGALAYRVAIAGEPNGETATADETIAEVYVHPDRIRVEFSVAPDRAAEAAGEAGLRVRPKAVRPPRTIVFVEDGAQVKWILPAFEAVLEAAGSATSSL